MSEHWRRRGILHVLVVTGMPEQMVQVGVGQTRALARENLCDTPIQSCGPDSGISAAMAWARNQGWLA